MSTCTSIWLQMTQYLGDGGSSKIVDVLATSPLPPPTSAPSSAAPTSAAPTTATQTTAVHTTAVPTTAAKTTAAPTTAARTTAALTTAAPTTAAPTTAVHTTAAQTTTAQTTAAPTTAARTTAALTTAAPTTAAPTTAVHTTAAQTTTVQTTAARTTAALTTAALTTAALTTAAPTTATQTTAVHTTAAQTTAAQTTAVPTTAAPTTTTPAPATTIVPLPSTSFTTDLLPTTAAPASTSAPPVTSTPPPVICDCGTCGCCAGCFFSRFNNSCVGCPAGTVSSICQDNAVCDACPPGDYCPYSHMTSPLRCPAGSFAEAGAVVCTLCSADGADAAQCLAQSRSSQFQMYVIITLCSLADFVSAFLMFRHVSTRTNSRFKPALWTILALALGPIIWLILLMYKHLRNVRPGYVQQIDYGQLARIPRSDIKIDNSVMLAPSRGGFGQVFMGCLNGRLVAVKELLVFPLSERDAGTFHNEATVMRSITHTNCVRLEGTCGPPDRFALVMEWMSGGNLYEALGRLPPNEPPPVHKRVTVMRQISIALRHLHSKNIIHGDIKSMNIMLSEPNCDGEAKLADFGLSRMRTSLSGSASPPAGVGGSFHYQSPEMLCDGKACSPESDVYAFGMLLYEAVLGRKPWDGLTISQVEIQLRQGQLPAWDPHPPAGISDEHYSDVQDLMRECCQQDPSHRINADNVAAKLAVLDVNNPANHTALQLLPDGFRSVCTTLMECLDHVNVTRDLAMRGVHARVYSAVQAHLLQPSCAQFICSNNLLQVEAECIAAYTWNAVSPHTPYLAFNTACRRRDEPTLVHWRHFTFHFLNGMRCLSISMLLLLPT